MWRRHLGNQTPNSSPEVDDDDSHLPTDANGVQARPGTVLPGLASMSSQLVFSPLHTSAGHRGTARLMRHLAAVGQLTVPEQELAYSRLEVDLDPGLRSLAHMLVQQPRSDRC